MNEAQCFFKFPDTCVENVRLVQLNVFGYVAADWTVQPAAKMIQLLPAPGGAVRYFRR